MATAGGTDFSCRHGSAMDRCCFPVRAYSGTGCSPFYASGVQPDTSDGTSWASLIGFRMKETGVGPGPGIPHVGSFTEVYVPFAPGSLRHARCGFAEPGRKRAALVLGGSDGWHILCLVAHRFRAALGFDACHQLLSPEHQTGRPEHFPCCAESWHVGRRSTVHSPGSGPNSTGPDSWAGN